MGLSSSTLAESHWSDILAGKKPSASATLPLLGIAKRAEIIRKLSFSALWQNFLDSTSDSFALVQTDVCTILKASGYDSSVELGADEILKFTQLWMDITSKKSFDFMSIYLSAIVLADNVDLDSKIDLLYDCIDLTTVNGFGVNELYVALKSFDVGMSVAFGMTPMASEGLLREMASSWMQFMEVQQRSRGSAAATDGSGGTIISRDQFFDFCNNRQLHIRRLLELLSVVPFRRVVEEAALKASLGEAGGDAEGMDEDAAGSDQFAPCAEKRGKNAKSSGVVDPANNGGGMSSAAAAGGGSASGTEFEFEATGGDEWMANPAWKKTAENMLAARTKAGLAPNHTKPESNLELEWVHGYRGYDCRDNVRCIDRSGDSIVFFAAALTIVQEQPAAATSGAIAASIERKNLSSDNSGAQQHYFGEHSDDILCMEVFEPTAAPSGQCLTLIATGEIGKTPAICVYVYNSKTKSYSTLSVLRGYHKRGVNQLAFSPDGALLCSVGVDYTIGIYNTKVDLSNEASVASVPGTFGKLLVSLAGPKGAALKLCASRYTSSYSFVTCGEKHVSFWPVSGTVGKAGMTTKEAKASLGSGKSKTYVSLARICEDCVVSGTSDGDLVLFNHKYAALPLCIGAGKTAVAAHAGGAVNALWTNPAGTLLISGGSDRQILLWSIPRGAAPDDKGYVVPTLLKCLSVNDVIGSLVPGFGGGASASTVAKGLSVRSVCMSVDNSKIVFGTQSCSVFSCTLPGNVVEAITGNSAGSPAATAESCAFAPSSLSCLVHGHYHKELWGLDIRPPIPGNSNGGEFCTVGDDSYLRVWSLATKSMLRCVHLGAPSRCCAYSPDGLTIAVGLGSPDMRPSKTKKGGDKKGKSSPSDLIGVLRVYRNDENFTVCFESQEAKKWISELKFSPDGRTLAMGAHDNNIYFYNVTQNFKRKAKFGKHSASILHFDFTSDGKYLQTNCNAYELMFCDTSTGQQMTKGQSLLANAEWNSMTCRLDWGTLGIWTGTMDGSDVNSVCRSPDQKLLASGDDFGKVKLYRYPATDPAKAACNEYTGHSSHVTCVRWISSKSGAGKNREHLISLGGEDKCIFQWRLMNNDSKDSAEHQATIITPAIGNADVNGDDAAEDDDALLDMPTGGDEFMAVKPWLGAIVAPTAWATPDPACKAAYLAALGELSTHYTKIQDDIVSATLERVRDASKSAASRSRTAELYGDLQRYVSSVDSKSQLSGMSDSSAPTDDDLELDWVHGYRGYDCRNNTWYLLESGQASRNPNGVSYRGVVYHAAALGVVLYPHGISGKKGGAKSQRFFRGHTDDIMSMDVASVPSAESEGKVDTIVATGQIGKGNVFVWNARTLKTLATLPTKQKTVLLVAFTSDRRCVVSIGQDNTIVVSDWRNQVIMITTKADPAVCNHISCVPPPPVGSGAASPTGNSFFLCGDKLLRLYTINGKNLNSVKITTTGKGSPQNFWSVASCITSDGCVCYFVGCDDGGIYMISTGSNADGKYVIQSVMAHHSAPISVDSNQADDDDDGGEEPAAAAAPAKGKGKGKAAAGGKKKAKSKSLPAITAMVSNQQLSRLVTGAKDGSIVLWDLSPTIGGKGGKNAPTAIFRFKIQNLDNSIFAKQIQSLAIETIGENCTLLLVGTRGCDLVEVDVTTANANIRPVLHRVPRTATASSTVENAPAFIMRAHCNNELWGVATHPTAAEYCTAGDDKTLRFYDIADRQMLGMVPIGGIARAVAYHPSGNVVIVGFGGRVGRGKEADGGSIRVYLTQGTRSGDAALVANDLNPLLEATDHPKQWISDIKFSPDGSTVAVGAHDNIIHLYNFTMATSNSGPKGSIVVSCTLTLKCKFTKHNASISHLDFSADGRYLQSNCNAYELLFSDTSNGKQITSASQLKDVSWDTWTCALGWPAQGIWGEGMDGSDINSVTRSHSGHLLASGDDFGVVNLYRYPCDQAKSAGLKFLGHSSHVMNLRWSVCDGYLVSVGGDDKCIFQWKHVMTGGGGGTSAGGENDEDDEFGGAAASSGGGGSSSGGAAGAVSVDNIGLDLLDEMPSGGDESMAVKPWLGAIRAPKNPPPISTEPPAVKLTTKWVHGYTSGFVGGTNMRVSSNLYYNKDGDAVYPAAALGVKLGRETSKGSTTSSQTQKYFTGHNDDIMCLAMSPNRLFVATGQCASVNDMTKATKGKGSICIWDAVNCTLLSQIVGCHQRAVTALAFSPNSDQLLSVGQDDSNTHTLYSDAGGNWSRVTKVGTSKGDKTPVMFSRWLSLDHPKVQDDEYEVVTGGGSAINFWKIEGGNMSKKAGKFGRKYKQVPLLCAGNLKIKDGWRVVCGTSTGDLYLFDENKEVTNAVEKAHEKAILCMVDVGGEDAGAAAGGGGGAAGGSGGRLTCGYMLITGSKDGVVKIWNQSLQPVSSFDINAYSLSDGAIGSLDVVNMQVGTAEKVTKLLLGTYGGEIIEVSLPEVANGAGASKGGAAGKGTLMPAANVVTDFSNARTKALLYSHHSGELWGVATHPHDADLYATVGDEGTLRVWSIEHSCLIASVPLYHPARCVSWNSSGTVIAVGFHEAVKGGRPKKKKSKKSKNESSDGEGSGNAANPNAHTGSVHLYSFNRQQAVIALQQIVAMNAGGGVRAPAVGTTAAQANNHNLMLPNSSTVLVKRADGCTLTTAWISEVRFSPNDRLLAIASHDKKCYVYNLPEVAESFIGASTIPAGGGAAAIGDAAGPWDEAWAKCLTSKPRFIFNKHSGAIVHVDFTSDSRYMQTNCNAYELLFCDASNGKHETSASKLANYNNSILGSDEGDDEDEEGGVKQWASQTCTLGWPVQGIWPAGADGTDINAVDRHFSHKYVATSDDFGLLKLFRYPCVKENSKFVSGKGHSSHVTCVRWAQHTTDLLGSGKGGGGGDSASSSGAKSGTAKTSTCEYAVTTGGNDKCVIVWEVKER